MAEIGQQGSSYLFGLVDSQLSVFVWAGSIDISFCVNEPAMHGSAWKMRNLPFDEHLGGSRPRFKLSGSQRAVVSQSPRVQLIVHQLDTNMREAAFNFLRPCRQFDFRGGLALTFKVSLPSNAQPTVNIKPIRIERAIDCNERDMFFWGGDIGDVVGDWDILWAIEGFERCGRE